MQQVAKAKCTFLILSGASDERARVRARSFASFPLRNRLFQVHGVKLPLYTFQVHGQASLTFLRCALPHGFCKVTTLQNGTVRAVARTFSAALCLLAKRARSASGPLRTRSRKRDLYLVCRKRQIRSFLRRNFPVTGKVGTVTKVTFKDTVRQAGPLLGPRKRGSAQEFCKQNSMRRRKTARAHGRSGGPRPGPSPRKNTRGCARVFCR